MGIDNLVTSCDELIHRSRQIRRELQRQLAHRRSLGRQTSRLLTDSDRLCDAIGRVMARIEPGKAAPTPPPRRPRR